MWAGTQSFGDVICHDSSSAATELETINVTCDARVLREILHQKTQNPGYRQLSYHGQGRVSHKFSVKFLFQRSDWFPIRPYLKLKPQAETMQRDKNLRENKKLLCLLMLIFCLRSQSSLPIFKSFNNIVKVQIFLYITFNKCY